MTPPKDVSIKVGNVTLSTANVPKDGIDLTKLSDESQHALSIFDLNKDKKLSKNEINKAIIRFENADKDRLVEDFYGDEITKKKNGELENAELKKIKYRVKGYILHDQYFKENVNSLPEASLMQLEIDECQDEDSKYSKHIARVNELKSAAIYLQEAMVRENAIKKNGLQETYNKNWLKDSEGNHYRYNGSTMKFEKAENVEYVAKDGSYRTRVKNKKGQQVVRTFTNDNNGKIKVLNAQNKVYIKPDYAAKVAGLTKFSDFGEVRYKAPDGTLFAWDKEKHMFIQAPRLHKYGIQIMS